MATSLIDKLEKLTDKRRAEGKRHKISTVVIISIMAIVSQIYSLRGIESFIRRHRPRLIELLKIGKNGLPSFYVIRTVLQQIDFDELAKILYEWLTEQKLLDQKDWISIDGKSIKSTFSDYNSVNQNFVSIVTAFAHKCGVSLLSAKYENKKTSEIEVVESLIRAINLENKVYTLDALHTKKNS